jgi:ribonuclease HI
LSTVPRSIDESQTLFVYFDGLCEPKNPGGVATYGVIIQRNGETVFEDCGLAEAEPWSDDASNNVAEYSAVIHALEWLDKNKQNDSNIVIHGDSNLIVSQLNGKYKVKSLRIVELHHKAKKLLSRFSNLTIEWVDRSLNQEADRLSRIAYKRYIRTHKEQP